MKKLLIVMGAMLIIIIIFAATIFMKSNEPYSNIIDMNWSIKLPNSYVEVYSKDSGPSFHGDGERYHVFEYDEDSDISQALKWVDRKNNLIEEEIKEVLDKLEVPDENTPNFENNYRYYVKMEKDSSKIYLIYFSDTKRLYVIENII